MDSILTTFELALIMILPLILYYLRAGLPAGKIVLYIAVLDVFWFGTYSLLHELCHLFTSRVTGAEIMDYQLIPRFWEGDFRNGYVNADLETTMQWTLSPLSPYIRDMIFLAIGYFLLKGGKIRHPLQSGAVITLFVLSPIYDVFNNYFAFVLGARNDFNAASGTIGVFVTHMIGIAFLLSGLIVLRWYFEKPNRKYPE